MAASTAQQRAHPSQTMAIAENFFMSQFCQPDVAANGRVQDEFGAIMWRTYGEPNPISISAKCSNLELGATKGGL